MANKLLTKSKYLNGLQCPKLLWISVNDKKRIPEPDISAKHNFEVGDMIGVLATKNFPNGIDLSNKEFKENLEKTKEAVVNRQTIYEAGFLVDDLFSRGDILLPVGDDEWDIIEVKSASKVKDLNIHDLAFQKYIYEKAGLKIRNCILMHLNSEYLRDGEIDVEELFVQADITEKVEEFSEGIKERIEKMFVVINGEEPEFSVDDLLTIEYDNICKDEFMASLPEESIFELYRLFTKKKVELYKEGIVKMNEVPESVKLNDKQKIQRRLAHGGGQHIDDVAIKNFLGNLKYPIYYLDFETINPAIPKFNGMKPYQRIPFQFSLHIQKEKNGVCEHVSFLAKGKADQRKEFMQALKDNLGTEGSVLVYNQGFEKGVMNEGATAFPEFREWYEENILPRVKDLMIPFTNFDFYDSRQKGSASIKAVLPVLTDLSYKDLDIGNGILASLEYERVTFDDVDESDRLKVYEDLEEYCKLDTWAEVEIVKALWKFRVKNTFDERD
ncbi:DUF2779 domain-containing protein [archaeon]|jgi:hypothetical protein|nr:DUF2779 domain-containing protein [archaeon]MBT6606531.1 DUF2779 domain-containing protein [archaeon]